MMKISIKKLSLRAFRSFVEHSEIDLPSSGLHRIDGVSGAGKTGFIEGIGFALGYSDVSATEHQSWGWLTEESMEVGLGFQVGDQDCEIVRGKKPTLRFGPNKKTGATTVNKALPEVLGISPDLLKILTYRKQRAGGLFLGMTNEEKKTFLTSLLGIGGIENALEVSQKTIGAIENDLSIHGAKLEQARSSVPQEQPRPEMESIAPLEQQLANTLEEMKSIKCKKSELSGRLDGLKMASEIELSSIKANYRDLIADQDKLAKSIALTRYEVSKEDEAKLEKLKFRLGIIRDGISKLEREHEAKLQTIKDRGVDLKNQLQATKEKVAKADSIKHKLTNAEADLDQLQYCGVCYTCQRPWGVNENSEKVITECKASVEALREELVSLVALQETIPALEASIAGARAEYLEIHHSDAVPEKFRKGEAEYSALVEDALAIKKSAEQVFLANRNKDYSEANSVLSNLKAELSEKLQVAQQPSKVENDLREELTELDRRILGSERNAGEIRMAMSKIASSNKVKTDTFDIVEGHRLAAVEIVKGLESGLGALQAKLYEEKDYHGLLKSFLALVFDETLQSIAIRANEFLRNVQNCAGRSLEFVSERETKTTKTIRQEIKAIVRVDGHEISLRGGCSGGQQAAIELAVDLALAEVIADRTGVMAGWLILDEPFDGLDVVSKEGCMEILAQGAHNRAIYVIDHSSEVCEMFSSVVSITMKDGRSSFSSNLQ
jgi:DNA repair exonuclease SbcCD ATPase subunit